jgi:signal transduction histidine kinase
MSRWFLLLLPIGILLGVLAEATAFDPSDPVRWIPDLVVGWTFMACGLVTGLRAPHRLAGVLMVATGFTWFSGNFANGGIPVIAWLASAALFLHRGPLVHLILSYPDGRLASTAANVAVGAGYGAALVPSLWDGPWGAVVMSALVLPVAVPAHARAVGRARRLRLLAMSAALTLCLAVVGGVVARAASSSSSVSLAALLVYEAALCAIAVGLCIGLVLEPWRRGEVADLIVELGSARGPTVRSELARALQDPSLQVGYWVAELGSFVDAEGRRLDLPRGSPDRSTTFLQREGEPGAVIVHDPAALDDPRILEAVTAAAHLGAVNARLQAELRRRVMELEASRRRIVEAEDEERRQLEQRLSRGAERGLVELVEELRGILPSTTSPARDRVDQAARLLQATLADLRRLGQGLRPRILEEQGLTTALEALAALSPVPVQVRADVLAGAVPPQIETALYYLCAEGLANVAKHASASTAVVSVSCEGDRVRLSVADDGVGGAHLAPGSGLDGLQHRIAELGGTLRVTSSPGAGTTLAAEMPLAAERHGRGSPAR